MMSSGPPPCSWVLWCLWRPRSPYWVQIEGLGLRREDIMPNMKKAYIPSHLREVSAYAEDRITSKLTEDELFCKEHKQTQHDLWSSFGTSER